MNMKQNQWFLLLFQLKDYADVTEQCLKSLFEKTTYKNYEVILMNNNSERKKLLIYSKISNKYSI